MPTDQVGLVVGDVLARPSVGLLLDFVGGAGADAKLEDQIHEAKDLHGESLRDLVVLEVAVAISVAQPVWDTRVTRNVKTSGTSGPAVHRVA